MEVQGWGHMFPFYRVYVDAYIYSLNFLPIQAFLSLSILECHSCV